MSEAPAGLYVHVPFCSRVCPYCDFAVRTGGPERRRRYTEYLLEEIALYAGFPLRFDTIYFGGGTPSLLALEDLERIVERAREQLAVDPAAQIFLEANPEDASREALAGWRRLGVRTLSLGLQSLDPAGLSFLGRRHTADEARRAVALAREVGFPTISVDLIYGLPGQSEEDWRRELDRALELRADHLSCYQLTIHQGTRFGLLEKRGKLTQPSNDAQGALFRLTHRYLNDAGMQGYEVSQFARGDAHRSRHNRKYWDHTPYLGLGPSAHSYHGDRRWWNIRRTDDWQERVDRGERPLEGEETLDAQALVLEALMTGLRTYAGVDLDWIEKRWRINLRSANGPLLEQLQADALATMEEQRLIPTLEGLALADTVATRFDLHS